MKKVMASESGQTELLGLPVGKRFEALVSARKPFGLDTSFKGKTVRGSSDLVVYRNGGRGYTPRSGITAGGTLVDKWKIFIGYAAPGTGNRDTYPHRVISTPFVGEPGSISSETYLAIGPFETDSEAINALSYLSCRLPRLLIQLRKATKDVNSKVCSFVPAQEW